ncbi:MAG: hypothetical protein LBR80_10965 [Deltaproteobacteria bacterium]|nr:hypothetical protein [Deltaproteobacteria bacterium]
MYRFYSMDAVRCRAANGTADEKMRKYRRRSGMEDLSSLPKRVFGMG